MKVTVFVPRAVFVGTALGFMLSCSGTIETNGDTGFVCPQNPIPGAVDERCLDPLPPGGTGGGGGGSTGGVLGPSEPTPASPGCGNAAMILARSCAIAGPCHAGVSVPDLNVPIGDGDYTQRSGMPLVGGVGLFCAPIPFVNAATPTASAIVDKISNDDPCAAAPIGGARMPLNGDPLPQPEIQCLTDWVTALANGTP